VSKTDAGEGGQAKQNEMINIHFKDETIEKMSKDARQKAAAEIKDKAEKIKGVLEYDEKSMQVKYTDNSTTTQTPEGEMTIKCVLVADFSKPEPK
jgi:hypothetical protein